MPENPLRAIDQAIRPGECAALASVEGPGKTSPARRLNALLLPAKVQVLIGSHDTRDWKGWAPVRSGMAMGFRGQGDQIVTTPLEDNVPFGVENPAVPASDFERGGQWARETMCMT